MLKLLIPETEFYDPVKEEFVYFKERTISLEHSLVSVSKWESIFKKSFLSVGPQTLGETLAYVKCMTITQNVDPKVYQCLSADTLKQIDEYIRDPMSATTFTDRVKNRPPSREVITSELIYYWMFSLGISIECQKWHLNRLLTLINIASIKNAPDQKMSKREAAEYQRQMNRARRAKLGTKG